MSQQLGGEPQERQRRARKDPWATEPWAAAAAVVVAVGMVMAAMVVAGMTAGVPGMVAVATVAVGMAVAAVVAVAARAMARVAARAMTARLRAMTARVVAARVVAKEAVAKEAVGRQSVRGSKLKSGPSPPLSAEKLLLFVLPPRISAPIVGDLAERLPSIQERHGDWFARTWYWRHAVGAVIRFVGPRLAGATSLGAVLRVARRLLSR
jgi:hypothetical protein